VNITQHQTVYCTRATPRRDPLGIVLHNTVGQALVPPHPNGSWHYEIDRDGAAHQYVNDKDYAWHVRATDEWRPPWMRWRDTRVSEANSCTVGIELVSFAGHPQCPPGYTPYTGAQYASTKELLALLYERYGALPVVTHGSLQLDRTDPVGFDFGLASLVWAGDGYRLEEGTVVEDTTPEERAAMQPYFEMLGVPVNMETALMKRAALAHKRGETRGPATSGEYPHGDHVRQDFTAGTCDFDPATGGVGWAEINLERVA
jgi:N-acetyl-anhydromuramyl-L-alanine amidase AmpD